ncbi:hypothetical protein ONE63_004325 [Megalurothrips usitatus]|uniref:Probable RNA polymerase II nuclear localization protein SLC7A6OS n=1 Tax=Megalurothrips usitatus TaxID=439358 RepID=A0AAV7X2H4_9NEOP|nr:hypothetical protein ONE63_004325 [Megalurothrips usitatus]
MAAVVRVKRSLDEEPSSGLILSCKRRKTDVKAEDNVEALFKFAGTVNDQEDNIALLNPDKLIKNDVKTSSRPTPNVSEKARQETKASSVNSRYKLVNCFRAIGNVEQTDCEGEEDANQNTITVLDVVADSTDKQVTKVDASAAEESVLPQYVYDLYYIQSDAKDVDVDDLLLDGLVSFAPVETELVFESYRNNRAGEADSDSDAPLMDDDEDSNDENNWRNDYPDEEGDDRDKRLIVFLFSKSGDEELSSDGDDERLIYTEDLSPSDVNMFGPAYARFKQKALKEVDSVLEINSDSDEDYNLTKSDDSTNENNSDNDFE